MNAEKQQPPRSSPRKVRANQQNAKASSGPKSDAGKKESATNALKWGFCSGQRVVQDEDPQQFQELWDHLWKEFRPRNAKEELVVEQIITTYWRLKRLVNIETAVFARESISVQGEYCGSGFAFINDAQSYDIFGK